MKTLVAGLALLLVLTGCQSTSYTASCNNRTDSNVSRCDISLNELSGLWSRDLNVAYIAESAGALPLSLSASVGQGTVRVSYTNAEGEMIQHELGPDAPLAITDAIQISDDQAHVEFMALDLRATDVQAVIEVGPG